MNRLIVTRGNTVRLVRLLALRLVAVGLILGSLNLPAQVPVAAAAPMTADLLDAVNIVAHPSLVDATTYEQARALTFKNNAAIQRAALNGYLTDGVYQVVQRDYAKLNEDFASRAANDAGATFTKQVSKTPSCFSPGTDSDYIVQVTSPGQIDQMQAGYNQYVNQYLDSNGMLGPDEFGTEWHRMLDTDFMADPNLITSEADFQAIGAKNNAAYTRRQAADMERVLRDRPTEDVPPQSEMTPEGVRAYAQEMQDMAQHRNQMLDAITANGDHLLDGSDARADWFKNMAIEEKYISRVEVLTDALRQQNGLAAVDRGDAGSIALRGSKRAFYDQNGNLTSNIERSGAAASVADNSLNRANFELANTVAEVAKTNPAFAASAPADIAAIAKQMNPGQKGFLLEQLRAAD